jgi:hypothetical protein
MEQEAAQHIVYQAKHLEGLAISVKDRPRSIERSRESHTFDIRKKYLALEF